MSFELDQLLYNLVSENSEIRSKAYLEFTNHEEEPDFSYRLFQIYLSSSGVLKSLALSAATNVISRNILRTDFSGLKSTFIQLLQKIRIDEQNLPEAKRIIFLLRKIIRAEYPQKWPEIFQFQVDTLSSALEIVKSQGELTGVRTWLFISNYIVKEQVSKRLTRDCNNTYEIGNILYPLVKQLWHAFNSSYNKMGQKIWIPVSILLDSLAIRLLYYGQKRPYLDKSAVELLSAILLKTTDLFSLKLEFGYLYKNINKLFKLLTHLINHEMILFACIDYGPFLAQLTEYLAFIKSSEIETLVESGLLLINAVFNTFSESTGCNSATTLESLTPEMPVKALRSSASRHLQAHLEVRPLEWYVNWLLDNFLTVRQKPEFLELPASLSSIAASALLSTISSGQNGTKIALMINTELSVNHTDPDRIDALLQLVKSAMVVAKHLDHSRLLTLFEAVIYQSGHDILRLRTLDAIDTLIDSHDYSENESERLFNILTFTLSQSNHINVRTAAISPLQKLYNKTNEYYYWQQEDSAGVTRALNSFHLVISLFISIHMSAVRTDCMNLLSKLICELNLQSDSASYQWANALTDILRIYGQSPWELRESILLMALSSIQSFDPYKCFLYLPKDLSIYYFTSELLVQTLHVSSSEYLDAFLTTWIAFLRIFPRDLSKVDRRLAEAVVHLFDNLIRSEVKYENEVLCDIFLEYLLMIISLFEQNCLAEWNVNECKVNLLLNHIENMLRNEVLADKILTFVNFLPKSYSLRFIGYSRVFLDNLLKSLNDRPASATEYSLLATISFALNYREDFHNAVLSLPRTATVNLENFNSLICNAGNGYIKAYYCFLYNNIARAIGRAETLPVTLPATRFGRSNMAKTSQRAISLLNAIDCKLKDYN